MLHLLRNGFWRETLALFIMSVLLGSLVVGGVAQGVQTYFEGAVDSLVGAPGEFDLIVHLRREAGDQGIQALHESLAEELPGYTLQLGPEIAGRMNALIGLPSQFHNRDRFESLETTLRDVPGFDGLTFVVEPSIVIKDVHPLLRDRFLGGAVLSPHVRFAFQHGSGVWAVLDSPEAVGSARRYLERMVGRLGVVEVRLPLSMSAAMFADAEESVIAGLTAGNPSAHVSALSQQESEAGPTTDLREARRVFVQLSGSEREELGERIEEAASRLEQAASAAPDNGLEADPAAALSTFNQALEQMELLEERLRAVTEQLRGAAAEGEATDVLVAVLLQRLIGRLEGEQELEVPEPAVDVDRLKAGLAEIMRRVEEFSSLDLASTAATLRAVEQGIPRVDAETGARIIRLLERLEDIEGGQNDRMEILLEGEWDESTVEGVAAEVLGDTSVRSYIRAAGLVEPSARTALLQLLSRARRIVAVLMALLITVVLLFLDMSMVISFLQRMSEAHGGGRARVRRAGVWFAGGVWGALCFATLTWLGGGAGGGLGAAWMLLPGFAVGMALAIPAGRISPIDLNQVQAALSLGLAEPEILREVIIPSGRPGLLFWLNRGGRQTTLSRLKRG